MRLIIMVYFEMAGVSDLFFLSGFFDLSSTMVKLRITFRAVILYLLNKV